MESSFSFTFSWAFSLWYLSQPGVCAIFVLDWLRASGLAFSKRCWFLGTGGGFSGIAGWMPSMASQWAGDKSFARVKVDYHKFPIRRCTSWLFITKYDEFLCHVSVLENPVYKSHSDFKDLVGFFYESIPWHYGAVLIIVATKQIALVGVSGFAQISSRRSGASIGVNQSLDKKWS